MVDTVVCHPDPLRTAGRIPQLLGVLPAASPGPSALVGFATAEKLPHPKPCPTSGQPSPNDCLMPDYKDPNAFPQLQTMLTGPFTFGDPPVGS